MITPKDFTALILCAGRSSRMKDFKSLLPLGDANLIKRVISLYRSVEIEDIIVILGYEAHRVIPTLEELATKWVLNKNYERGMFSSIQTGVHQLKKESRAFFIHPVDIPFVQSGTIKSLIAAFQAGKVDVCRPCYEGRYGHPPLLSSTLSHAISEFDGEGGLRTLLAQYREQSLNVYCNDPGILVDIDTQEDYERALKNFSLFFPPD